MFDFDGGFPTLTTAGFDVELEVLLDKKPQNPQAFLRFQSITEKFVADSQGYGILAIDSLTTLQAAAMNQVIRINPLKDRRFAGTLNLTTQNDFGVLVGLLNQFFPQFIALSEHMALALTCHMRLEQDELTKQIRFYPAVSGRALPTQIHAWFNEVWWVKTEGQSGMSKRVVQTASDFQISLKTQIKDMPFTCSPEEACERLALAYRLLRADQVKIVHSRTTVSGKPIASSTVIPIVTPTPIPSPTATLTSASAPTK